MVVVVVVVVVVERFDQSLASFVSVHVILVVGIM